MAAVNSSEPAHPGQNQAYETQGNPASKAPAEQSEAKANASDESAPTDQRIPSQQTASVDEATPSASGRGIRGAGKGENASDLTDQEQGKTADVEAAQMEVPGEGKVASAVKGTQSGAAGSEPGQETDLDRKKAEQAPMREEAQEGQKKDVDVQGVLNSR